MIIWFWKIVTLRRASATYKSCVVDQEWVNLRIHEYSYESAPLNATLRDPWGCKEARRMVVELLVVLRHADRQHFMKWHKAFMSFDMSSDVREYWDDLLDVAVYKPQPHKQFLKAPDGDWQRLLLRWLLDRSPKRAMRGRDLVFWGEVLTMSLAEPRLKPFTWEADSLFEGAPTRRNSR